MTIGKVFDRWRLQDLASSGAVGMATSNNIHYYTATSPHILRPWTSEYLFFKGQGGVGGGKHGVSLDLRPK